MGERGRDDERGISVIPHAASINVAVGQRPETPHLDSVGSGARLALKVPQRTLSEAPLLRRSSSSAHPLDPAPA
jgi:hypothetical protein